MANPHTIPEEFRTEFSNLVEFQIQQKMSKYKSRVRVDNYKGKEKVYVDQESTSFNRRVGRLQQTVLDEAQFNNRKSVKVPFTKHFVFDQWDEEFLGELGRPDSETVQNLTMAFERTIDTEIATAASATVYGGPRPHVTAITVPDSQKVAVQYGTDPGANIGLTPDKLIKVCSIFEENELDPTEYETFITIDPASKMELMAAVKASPNDVWAMMVSNWLEGKDKKLFNMTPIMTNRVTVDSGGIAELFAWTRDKGLYIANENLNIKIDVRPDLEHALQISAYGQLAVMRRHEEAVVLCYADHVL